MKIRGYQRRLTELFHDLEASQARHPVDIVGYSPLTTDVQSRLVHELQASVRRNLRSN